MWLCVIYIWFVFQELSSCFLFILHLIYLFTYSFIYFFWIDKTCLILSNSFFSEKTTSHNSNAIMKKKKQKKKLFYLVRIFPFTEAWPNSLLPKLSDDSPEILQDLCVSTKFPQQEIRVNCDVLCGGL